MYEDEYMSGSELRQYLHISTRKMKYLMDHNYIPHVNTGYETHKYKIKMKDAEKFKYRMEHEKGFLSEIEGLFSNPHQGHPKPPTETQAKISKHFELWLYREWKQYPDALPTKDARKLIGSSYKTIRNLVESGKLHGVTVGSMLYLCKDEFIHYTASEEKMAGPKNAVYLELIKSFKQSERKKQEAEKRKLKSQLKKEK